MKRLNYRVLFFVSVLMASALGAAAQEAGIKGRVLEAGTDRPIAGASIRTAGTGIGTSTDENGGFALPMPEKPADLVLLGSFVGYETDSITVRPKDRKTLTTLIFHLRRSGSEVLAEVVVSRRRESFSEAALLADRQASSLMVEKIGSPELARKGVGDVAAALGKMSGVSGTERGDQVYVRGLGDRYNSTSLNGMPMPSNDPERKNIDLELFTTDIVGHIAMDKVYRSAMAGDFAGGNVDIASKKHSGRGTFEISLGSQSNTNVLDRWNGFLLQQGPSRAGFASYGVPNDPLGGYRFQNSLDPIGRQPMAGNIGLTGGRTIELANGQRIGLFALAKHTNDHAFRDGSSRSVSAGGESLNAFRHTQFAYRTNSTGMLNADYAIRPGHGLAYNLLFVNSSDQSRERYAGFIRDLAENGTGIKQRSTFVQNRILVNQLLGRHSPAEKVGMDWGVSYNTVRSRTPDRLQNITRMDDVLNHRVLAQNTEPDNHRYYQTLTENELAFRAAANYLLGAAASPKGKLAMGYDGRIKRREFEDIQFNLNLKSELRQREVDPDRLDEVFNPENHEKGLFDIRGYTLDFPQVYMGKQDVHALFAESEYRLTDRLTGVLGLRYENVRQSIRYQTNLDRSGKTNAFKRNSMLPSLLLRYALDERQNLRLAASRSHTLPQFKERALFIYDYGNETKVGNPDLYPSQNYNLDARWEMFPRAGELLSVTLFGKYIKDPINEVTLASSSNDVSYLNTGDFGTVFGAELEFRKDLFSFGGGANQVSAGGNLAYMKTRQELSAEKVRRETNYNLNLTHDRSGFTGASDLLANADLSLARKQADGSSLGATLVYQYFSDKLHVLGTEGQGNQIDRGVSSLDLVLRWTAARRWGVDLKASNLLDPAHERFQDNDNGPVTVMSYKKGVQFSLGLKYAL